MADQKTREQKNRERFEAAKANGRVCVVWSAKGKPIYFNVPDDAGDEDINRLAFQAKHGRPMTKSEELFYELAEGRGGLIEKALG